MTALMLTHRQVAVLVCLALLALVAVALVLAAQALTAPESTYVASYQLVKGYEPISKLS